MRLRLLLTGALLAAALALPSGALASGGNPQTAGLQVALRAQGLYRGAIDAIAGPETVAAVRDFQRVHGLPVTGIANARTRLALGPLGRPLFGARPLRRGNFGWDVAVLQFLLLHQGISVPENAYFDGPTLHGVRVMQRRFHLRPDGIVGPHTFTAIVRRVPVPLARRSVVVALRHPHHHHRSLAVHVVRAGESLSEIARRYDTTVARLARINHLDPAHFLLIGTKLRVPRSSRPHVAVTRTADRVVQIGTVRSLLDYWAMQYGISTHLVRALAWMESGWNNELVSPAGATGVMQLLPTTFRFAERVLIGHPLRHDAGGNVQAGVAFLAHLLRDFHGNAYLALGAWYQGEHAVRHRGLFRVSRRFASDVLALEQRM